MDVAPALNIAQQLFLVLFSILYGIMLQSITGLQPFPLARTRKGYMNRHHEVDLLKCEFWECERVFAKKKDIPIVSIWDDCNRRDYGQWLIRMWGNRVRLSVFLLNVLPFIHFCTILFLLGNHQSLTTFGETIPELILPTIQNLRHIFYQAFHIGIIFWAALGVFGFYRIYHAIAASRWETLFCDVDLKHKPLSFDTWAHLGWGIVFYLLPPLHYLLLFNFHSELLGTWGVYPVLFLIWLICVADC